MTGVGEHFVYLGLESHRVTSERMLSRDVGISIMGRPIKVALDSQRHKHLLVPAPNTLATDDRSSQGVTLAVRELLIGETPSPYVDIECRIPALDLVFERLLDDMLERLRTDSNRSVAVCQQALDDWRSLLRTAGDAISRDVVVGLVGELEVLRLLAARSPSAALASWLGPTRTVHDFIHGRSVLEVKTTASIDGTTISISNIAQLDPGLVGQLHLIVVHVALDGTAPSLDDRIDELVAMGVPKGKLLERVSSGGYVYETQLGIDDRYAARSIRIWTVGEEFPGLRASDMPPERMKGISEVEYKLHLDAAPSRLSDDNVSKFWNDWLGTPS